jgi:sugar lactone lactonase YvrE
VTRAAALSLLFLSAAAAPQQTLLDWLRATRAARLKADARAWADAGEHALALAPDHPDLLVSVARAHAALGEAPRSLELLRGAVGRGAGIDIARVPELQKLPPSPELAALSDSARANLAPVARAQPFALLRKESLSEGIAWDPVSRRLFAGTANGQILQVNERGEVSSFVEGTGLRDVLGLKVDARRGLLWAVSGTFPDLLGGTAKPDDGVSGVQVYRLKDGKLVAKHWLDERPVLHGFNDLALANDGDAYVTDSAQAAVYRVHAGRLEKFVQDEHLTIANGIALAKDQRRLYVAHVEGLTLVDLKTRKLERVRVPADASVNSIDGLAFDGEDLLGVQGSPYLARVERIELSADGRSVVRVTTVNARTPAEYGQTTAAVAGKDLYVVVGSPAVDTAGVPLTKEPLPQIVRIPLR